jgi:hypothetical protein
VDSTIKLKERSERVRIVRVMAILRVLKKTILMLEAASFIEAKRLMVLKAPSVCKRAHQWPTSCCRMIFNLLLKNSMKKLNSLER